MKNYLVLLSDEHNPKFCGPYGNTTVQTPEMDALAARGTVFENAYCPSPVCLASRSSFLSSQRVHAIQTYNNCMVHLDPSPESFGAALARQGVHSAFIGKTDVYRPGAELGFSEMILPGDRQYPGDQNIGRAPFCIRTGAHERADGFGPVEDAARGDRKCIQAALDWLANTAPRLDQPWVLVVNIGNPHFPHYARPDLWDKYPDGGDLPEYGVEEPSAQHPFAKALRDHFEADMFTEEQVRGLRRGYRACVSFVDEQVGRLVRTLAEHGFSDRTNFVYTSDHGDMLGKFGMWWKCSLYEDSAHIPMIAAGPDFPAGQRVATPVDLHDLQADFFRATGALKPKQRLGDPLAGILVNDPDRVVFSEYHGHGAPANSYLVRKGDWKYLFYANDAPNQLFNLREDPEELRDLAAVRLEKVAELDAELRRICDPEQENARAAAFIEGQLASLATGE